MRKTATTINPALSRVISETGHTDLLVVTDAGLPIPPGSERIDLAYRPGAPAFLDVLDTVLAELVVEGATVSEEIAEKSPEILAALRERFAGRTSRSLWSPTSSSRRSRTPRGRSCARASSPPTPTSSCTRGWRTDMTITTTRSTAIPQHPCTTSCAS